MAVAICFSGPIGPAPGREAWEARSWVTLSFEWAAELLEELGVELGAR